MATVVPRKESDTGETMCNTKSKNKTQKHFNFGVPCTFSLLPCFERCHDSVAPKQLITSASLYTQLEPVEKSPTPFFFFFWADDTGGFAGDLV